MEKKTVIARKNLSTNLPLWSTITAALLLDRVKAPGWVWGVVMCVFGLLWIASLIALFKIDEPKDIFKGRKGLVIASASVAISLLFLFAVPAFAAGPSYLDRPDQALTPGAADPAVTQANIQQTICVAKYTAKVRNVPGAEKTAVIARYRAKYHRWPATHVEIDHLVSLELGGSNDVKNLWPEHYAGPFGARVKDRAENYLHRQVCAGRILLKDAQWAIEYNWIGVYRNMPVKPKARRGK